MSGSSTVPALPVYNQDAPGLLAAVNFTAPATTQPAAPTQPTPVSTRGKRISNSHQKINVMREITTLGVLNNVAFLNERPMD